MSIIRVKSVMGYKEEADAQKHDSTKPSSFDIFQTLMETAEKEKKKRREELLAPLGVKSFC